MIGSSFGALAFRRVCNYPLRDPSFSDGVNVFQVYAVLVFETRRAAVLLPFQVHRLNVLVQASLIAFSNGYFELASEYFEFLNKFSTAALRKFQVLLPAILTAFRGLL